MIDDEQKEKIKKEVLEWFYEAESEDQLEFKNCPFDNLIRYHHTLGREIRNHFELWKYSWVQQIEDGIDMSPDHPDFISQRIIEDVWKKLNSV